MTCAVAGPVLNGGQRIPSTHGGLGDVAAAPTVDLLGDSRVMATFGLFRARLDLRFLANWFSSDCIGCEQGYRTFPAS